MPSENVIDEVRESDVEHVTTDIIIDDEIDNDYKLIKPVICIPRGNMNIDRRTPVRRTGRERTPTVVYPLPDKTSGNNK